MCAPLTLEDNLELAPQVAAGDCRARDRMIEGNMPLVVSKVDNYIHFFPQYRYLRDDLTSAGFVGLVDAVNRTAREGNGVAAPVEYIGVSIARAIGECAEMDNTVPIPHISQRVMRANNKEITPMKANNLALANCTCYGEDRVIDMRDLIQSCCCCDEERAFVEMREAGYKLKEIAAAVNMPVSSLHVMKEDLYRRVLAKTELKDIR